MTNEQLLPLWRDPDHTWLRQQANGKTTEQNEASDLRQVKREISYYQRGGPNGLQFYPVEGWTTKAILDYMERKGIKRSAIREKLVSGTGAFGERWGESRRNGSKRSTPTRRVDNPRQAATDVWSFEELKAAIDLYMELLGSEQNNVAYSKGALAESRRKGLRRRTDSEVELRLRAISLVLSRKGLPHLQALPPSAHVDGRVEEEILSAFESRGTPLGNVAKPTYDEFELDARSRVIMQFGLSEPPVGESQPTKRIVTVTQSARLPQVRAYVLKAADGRCDACGEAAPFSDWTGSPFLEVHHVHALSDGGPDTHTNAVAVCPNCHRRLHYSSDRGEYRERLYQRIARLVRSP